MKFVISRTSSYDDKKPCEDAILEDCFKIDKKTFKSFEDFDRRFPHTPWINSGINHRITKEGIVRDFPTKDWFIEIENLEDLIKFSKLHGKLIIEKPDYVNYASIEIYDGYRE